MSDVAAKATARAARQTIQGWEFRRCIMRLGTGGRIVSCSTVFWRRRSTGIAANRLAFSGCVTSCWTGRRGEKFRLLRAAASVALPQQVGSGGEKKRQPAGPDIGAGGGARRLGAENRL